MDCGSVNTFQTGLFPDKMKAVKVMPLYKDGDIHLFINYAPVSLDPQFSKRLDQYFVRNSVSWTVSVGSDLADPLQQL